jgi:hypothetical protein
MIEEFPSMYEGGEAAGRVELLRAAAVRLR